jgi:hypothetical protein
LVLLVLPPAWCGAPCRLGDGATGGGSEPGVTTGCCTVVQARGLDAEGVVFAAFVVAVVLNVVLLLLELGAVALTGCWVLPMLLLLPWMLVLLAVPAVVVEAEAAGACGSE